MIFLRTKEFIKYHFIHNIVTNLLLIIHIVAILSISILLYSKSVKAGSCDLNWRATITDEVRVNSQGKRLTTIGQVLAQERYKYWGNSRIPDSRSFFHDKRNREGITHIPASRFDISERVRSALWECSRLEVLADLRGYDCDETAVDVISIVPTSSDPVSNE